MRSRERGRKIDCIVGNRLKINFGKRDGPARTSSLLSKMASPSSSSQHLRLLLPRLTPPTSSFPPQGAQQKRTRIKVACDACRQSKFKVRESAKKNVFLLLLTLLTVVFW